MTRTVTYNGAAPFSFVPSRMRFPFALCYILRGALFPIKLRSSKSGGPVEDDVKNVFHDGTIAIPALGLRPPHVRSIPSCTLRSVSTYVTPRGISSRNSFKEPIAIHEAID